MAFVVWGGVVAWVCFARLCQCCWSVVVLMIDDGSIYYDS